MAGTGSSRFSRVDFAAAVVLASAAWFTIPGAARLVRQAVAFAPLPYEQRRVRMFGEFYESLASIRARLPREARVAIVCRGAASLDNGVFASEYLAPRAVRLYSRLGDYLIDPPPQRPPVLLYIDDSITPAVRRMKYEEIRLEQLRRDPIVRDLGPETVANGGVVPFVASVDGLPPESYTTQAVFAASSDSTVTLTLEPSGETRALTLRGNQPRAFNDLVYEVFGVMKAGWMRIASTSDVRVAIWWVDRARRRAVRVPVIVSARGPQRLPGGDKLWLVNTSGRAANAIVNGTAPRTLPPYALESMPANPARNDVTGEGVIAFVSRRDAGGATELFWP